MPKPRCCPFKTSYGSYANSLISAIEKKTGAKMNWVASNCGCGDPIEVNRCFQAQQCNYHGCCESIARRMHQKSGAS